MLDDGDRAEEEQRSSGDEDTRDGPVAVDELDVAELGPVGLGVPALLRDEEEEEEVGDKMELLLRAFL